MKLKLLLLFLVVASWGASISAQTKKPYNNLIITEAQMNRPEFCYVEITNKGDETINLKNFEFGSIEPWSSAWVPGTTRKFTLPDKELAPGSSYVIATRSDYSHTAWLKDHSKARERVDKPEKNKIADLLLDLSEGGPAALDKFDSRSDVFGNWGGRDAWYLRHHYLKEDGISKDSMVIDQVNGMFTGTDGKRKDYNADDVAGVVGATGSCVLIRKNAVNSGVQDFTSTAANLTASKLQFSSTKGLDFADSEWIPVRIPGGENSYTNEPWRAVFWTMGNSVDVKLDANALVSKTGKVKVDLTNLTITVPWGVRNNDSIMYQFKRKAGLAWDYIYSPNQVDSGFISARTGDKLIIYACGNIVDYKTFAINVLPPTADDNIVIPKNGFNYTKMAYTASMNPYGSNGGYRISDGVPGMDTIINIAYATRVDTLYKYIEKAPKATFEIISETGARPDLKNGDILRVTSESGKKKDYFLKLDKFIPNANGNLASITWPDMPSYFKGEVAKSFGWKGDTIPGFLPSKYDYVVRIPVKYDGIPALIFKKEQTDSRVVVERAKTLSGTPLERTASFTVTAENDTTIVKYTVRFEKDLDPANVQQYKAEPFISQYVWNDGWTRNWIEIVNPGTEILDLSNYMIATGQYSYNITTFWNTITDYASAYRKYVPGKTWGTSAEWTVTPRMLYYDPAVSSLVYPGDVFVMADHGGTGDTWKLYGKEADVNFKTGRNPWGFAMGWDNAVTTWYGATYLFKIVNDSVTNGLKPATNPNDFELIDVFGNGTGNAWVIGGVKQGQMVGYTRKPNIYKGNPVLTASFGTTLDNSEWYARNSTYYNSFGYPLNNYKICDGIGSHTMDNVTIYKSTISSKVYKVSAGFSQTETIKGVITGTTVTDFLTNIIKADPLQTLTVKSGTVDLIATDAVKIGDVLVVLSADSVNTSKYILDVATSGLSNNAVLISTIFTIGTAPTGTIAGFKQGTLLKTILAGVVVPTGASLTITDENDAYMSLMKLNYDTAYVSVIATDQIFFKVIAEDGITTINYQLKPTSNVKDAYVTSDVYSVDQFALIIKFIPGGTSVSSLINNVTPAPGATVVIYDKSGNIRENGDIYKDDKLIVTSEDLSTVKAYYFSMLNFVAGRYLAFVISDDYKVDQIKYEISNGPMSSTTPAEFYAKLYPAPGATMKIIDANGNVSTLNDLSLNDQLLVTAADGLTTATYKIVVDITKTIDPLAQAIKVYPNPTSDGKVIVQGLSKGNRVQVFNAAGIALRDVIVENSTDYVSLASQPAGIYIFVISNGNQHISIQKIVKK